MMNRKYKITAECEFCCNRHIISYHKNEDGAKKSLGKLSIGVLNPQIEQVEESSK